MTNPWAILFVGIITVFMALFLIILFLLGFPRFFSLQKKKEHKDLAPLPEIVEVSKKIVTQADSSSQAAAQDEEELIAVLTAAIAAARGAEPGSFAIAQVKQSAMEGDGFNTPVWGRIERLSRK